MDKYIEYIDGFMKNCHSEYNIESSSSDSIETYNKQIGGTNSIDRPTGGYPPIYICDIKKEKELIEEEKKSREYKTHKSTISIKDIMEKRRDIKPFI